MTSDRGRASGAGSSGDEPDSEAVAPADSAAEPAAAARPYSVVRLYVPASQLGASLTGEELERALDHDGLEREALDRELAELLMPAEERRVKRLTRQPSYRALAWGDEILLSPEQPEARLPETARAVLQSLGDQMFSRIISPASLEEAHDAFTPDDDGPAARYMWAGSACVPISWLLMFSEEEARPVGSHGIVRVEADLALDRIRHAIATLAWATLPTDIVDELARTEDWLNPHVRGVVELDYGAASRILKVDDSPRDLGVALAALEERDTVTAVAAYRRFNARWKGVRDAILDGLAKPA